MQGGASGTENCDGRGLMYSAWPIRVGWVAGSGWMPIWLTNTDQLRSAHAEPGSQSNQPQSARVSCGSSVKSVFWIWSLRPGCSKVSWDLWNGTITWVLSVLGSEVPHTLLGLMRVPTDPWSYSRAYRLDPMISKTIRFLMIWLIDYLSITRLSLIWIDKKIILCCFQLTLFWPSILLFLIVY